MAMAICDVLTSNDTPDKKLVYLNNGKGQFTVAGTWGVGAWSTRNAAVADLNGDRKIDVIAANRPGPSFVCLNEGGGRFASDCIRIPAESATSIVPADFDKDGFIDLAVPEPRRRAEPRSTSTTARPGLRGRRRSVLRMPPRVSPPPRISTATAPSISRGDEKAASMVVYHQRRQGQPRGRLPGRGQGEDAVRDGGRRPESATARRTSCSATPQARTPCSSTMDRAGVHRGPVRRRARLGLRLRARRHQRRRVSRYRAGEVRRAERAVPEREVSPAVER